MRRLICAGNWKMHKTSREADAYVDAFLPLAEMVDAHIEIVLCPPFTALAGVAARIEGTRVQLGAQDVYWEESGAFTGEVAAPMLRDLGVRYVIVGHSERRAMFGETDESVRRKTAAALRDGLVPIVAVGETEAIRDSGKTKAHVVAQTRAALEGLSSQEIGAIVLAYEPVWAIGTGRNCDPDEANSVMAEIRACVNGLDNVPILYGGSVKPGNIAQYMAHANIDGGLVGGASLDPAGFAELCSAAAR